MSNGSIYPGGIDNFNMVVNGVDYIEAQHVNQLNNAINKIETELGTNPSGSFNDVKTRLDNIQINTLVDVDVSDPQHGQLIAYDDNSEKWENRTLSLGPDIQRLIISLNSINPQYQIDVNADFIQVEEYNLTSVSLLIDITQNGVNGLDTGAESADSWYSIWIIYNPDSDITAGLLSLGHNTPTLLPEGFTKTRLIGWVRNNSHSDFSNPPYSLSNTYHWRGDPEDYDFDETYFTETSSWTEFDLSNIVPPCAKAVDVYCEIASSNAGCFLSFRRNGQAYGIVKSEIRTYTASLAHSSDIIVPCDNDRKIEYYRSADITQINFAVKGWWM